MDDNKVFEPEVITESPYPNEVASSVPTNEQSSATGTFTSQTIKETKLPQKKISHELISTAMNTKSRKVLEEFTLQQSGGFKIGNYQEGTSGEVSITPNGIVAKNSSGINTIVIDGSTGDAIFAGEIRSGSTVTGSVEITDGYIAMYNDGLLSIFIGDDGN